MFLSFTVQPVTSCLLVQVALCGSFSRQNKCVKLPKNLVAQVFHSKHCPVILKQPFCQFEENQSALWSEKYGTSQMKPKSEVRVVGETGLSCKSKFVKNSQ